MNKRIKRLSIIGGGLAGCLSAIFFLKYTDWNIDWYLDPDDKVQDIDDSSDLSLPMSLRQDMNLEYNVIGDVGFGIKTGILKKGWGHGDEFFHNTVMPFITFHYNIGDLQQYILEFCKAHERIKLINDKVVNNQVTSDFIMNCSEIPGDDSLYHFSDNFPVNSVYTVKCPWDGQRFKHNLMIARPHGWVYGIPLENRCTIKYYYNSDINSLDDILEDIKQIFNDYNLTPSEETTINEFKFYYRKENIVDKICNCGNFSYSVDSIESPNIGLIYQIIRMAHEYWTGRTSRHRINNLYVQNVMELELRSMLHYLAGSEYNTEFWVNAVALATSYFYEKQHQGDDIFQTFVEIANLSKLYPNELPGPESALTEYAFWTLESLKTNLTGLNLYSKIKELELSGIKPSTYSRVK